MASSSALLRLVVILPIVSVALWQPSSEITDAEKPLDGNGITAGFCFGQDQAGPSCHYAQANVLGECAKGEGSGVLHSCDPVTCSGRGEPWCAWNDQCGKYSTFAGDLSGTLSIGSDVYSYTDSTHKLQKAYGHDFTTVDKSLCGGCVALRTERQDGQFNVVIAINVDNVGKHEQSLGNQVSPEADIVMDHLGADVLMPVDGGNPRPWERGDRIPFEWMLVDCLTLAEVSNSRDSWSSGSDTTTTTVTTTTVATTTTLTTTTTFTIASTTTSTFVQSTTAQDTMTTTTATSPTVTTTIQDFTTTMADARTTTIALTTTASRDTTMPTSTTVLTTAFATTSMPSTTVHVTTTVDVTTTSGAGKCRALTTEATDEWCTNNCNHATPFCPARLCQCSSMTTTADVGTTTFHDATTASPDTTRPTIVTMTTTAPDTTSTFVPSTSVQGSTTPGVRKCLALTGQATDQWCTENCNHAAPFCPLQLCRCSGDSSRRLRGR